MDMLNELTQRFTAAILKALPDRTPLIGPKWFQWIGKKESGHFRFIGCPKLAKATKSSPKRVADSVVKHLIVDDLNVTVKVSDEAIISVTPTVAAAADVKSE